MSSRPLTAPGSVGPALPPRGNTWGGFPVSAALIPPFGGEDPLTDLGFPRNVVMLINALRSIEYFSLPLTNQCRQNLLHVIIYSTSRNFSMRIETKRFYPKHGVTFIDDT